VKMQGDRMKELEFDSQDMGLDIRSCVEDNNSSPTLNSMPSVKSRIDSPIKCRAAQDLSMIASIDETMNMQDETKNMEEVSSSISIPLHAVYHPLIGHTKRCFLRSFSISQATYRMIEEGNAIEFFFFFLTSTPWLIWLFVFIVMTYKVQGDILR